MPRKVISLAARNACKRTACLHQHFVSTLCAACVIANGRTFRCFEGGPQEGAEPPPHPSYPEAPSTPGTAVPGVPPVPQGSPDLPAPAQTPPLPPTTPAPGKLVLVGNLHVTPSTNSGSCQGLSDAHLGM